jgi:hypothetical protein
MPARTVLCSTLAQGLMLPRPAAADVAAPDDYVEECTIEKRQTERSSARAATAVRCGGMVPISRTPANFRPSGPPPRPRPSTAAKDRRR